MAGEKIMEGKRVLVTGAGTGIGRKVAFQFAQAGASVVLHYSKSSRGAISTAAEINKEGGKAKAIQANFDNIEETRQLGLESVKFFGGLDVLVNNAGITFNKPFQEVAVSQFDRLFNVNVRSPFFLTQTVVPYLAESNNATVINISSIHASFAMRDHTVYAATKGAIVSFTRVLALELAALGIRVNTIAPGAIMVENHEKALGKDFDFDSMGALFPSGFVGVPDDVGEVALFLASPKSRYIIGQTIVVDGGLSATMPILGTQDSLDAHFGTQYVE